MDNSEYAGNLYIKFYVANYMSNLSKNGNEVFAVKFIYDKIMKWKTRHILKLWIEYY